MNKKYILILFCITLFHNNSAMQSKCIESIMVWPGAYQDVYCPTYITPDIYFKGTADLVDGSKNEPKITHLKINDQEIELIDKQTPKIDFFSRHPTIARSINYNKENKIESLKLFYINKKMDPIICTWSSSKNIPTFNHNNENRLGDSRSDIYFKNTEGNPHTIVEEKFQLPILNLFFGEAATVLINYYDIQLTENDTLPEYWHKWRIITKVINVAFELFIIYIACYKIAENYL